MMLKAPFPWFGGKSSIANLVWERFGDTPNFVEPFFGSGAVLLCRPSDHKGSIETVNDKDGFVSNFWRAVQADPDTVARHADWPVNENDLHARHSWLTTNGREIVTRLEGDAEFYDAKVAGWWVWGICCWIGSGWCSGDGPWRVVDGELVRVGELARDSTRKLPHLGDAGRGVNRQLPHLGNAGMDSHASVERKRPHLMTAGKGLNGKSTSSALYAVMQDLSDRLRRVRICSGDWSRVCGPSVTVKQGITAVFLDPPYAHQDRHSELYRVEMSVADDVRSWAILNGDDPRLRIALCGYDGEHEMPASWDAVTWKARGGYGSQGTGQGRENAGRETVWFNPGCLKTELPLFAGMAFR